MKLNIEQIFFGRGVSGYGVLGASPAGYSHAARVEALCGAVGTPGADYGGEPFLLSVPDGDQVMMICGRRGVPDSMGRGTLFFHALVADKSALANAKADAASLFAQGVFADKMPSGDIAPLCVDVVLKDGQPSGSLVDVITPCVIRSGKPAMDIVRAAVGNQVLSLSWATFAFQLMRGFDVQVIPSRTPAPRTVNEYDTTGKLIRSAARADSSRKEDALQRHHDETACSSIAHVSNVPSNDKSNVMFKLSVILNIVFAAVCVLLFSSRKSATDEPIEPVTPIVVTNTVEKIVEKRVPVQLSDAQRAEIEDAAIKRLCSELKDGFLMEREIRDFDVSVTKLPKYEAVCEDPKFEQQKVFLDNLKFYVDFVNKKLLKGETR